MPFPAPIILAGPKSPTLPTFPAATAVASASDAWSGLSSTNLTRTANQSDPAGGTGASLLINNSAATNVFSVMRKSGNISAVQYTASIYAKAGTCRYLFLDTFAASQDIGVLFDLQNGVVVGTLAFAVAPSASGLIPYPGGWYRCWITFTSPGAAAVNILQFGLNSDGNLNGLINTTSPVNLYAFRAEIATGTLDT